MVRIILVVLFTLFPTSFGNASESNRDILVTPDWLSEHLDDPSLVVLQAAELRPEYLREHIPGARFLWPNWLEKTTVDLSVELLPVETMVSVLERLGVSNSSQIVLCHTRTFKSAASVARVWATLDYLGMGDRTKILDGGFEAWKRQGKPVTQELPEFVRGTFAPVLKKDVFVGQEYVRTRTGGARALLVDTRRPGDFRGDASGVLRSGHIPGALSLPFASIIETNLSYAPRDSIAARFEAAGIQPGAEVVAYCYRGKAACLAYVAARMLGHEAHVYDGSYEEWSSDGELPLEVSSAGN